MCIKLGAFNVMSLIWWLYFIVWPILISRGQGRNPEDIFVQVLVELKPRKIAWDHPTFNKRSMDFFLPAILAKICQNVPRCAQMCQTQWIKKSIKTSLKCYWAAKGRTSHKEYLPAKQNFDIFIFDICEVQEHFFNIWWNMPSYESPGFKIIIRKNSSHWSQINFF